MNGKKKFVILSKMHMDRLVFRQTSHAIETSDSDEGRKDNFLSSSSVSAFMFKIAKEPSVEEDANWSGFSGFQLLSAF